MSRDVVVDLLRQFPARLARVANGARAVHHPLGLDVRRSRLERAALCAKCGHKGGPPGKPNTARDAESRGAGQDFPDRQILATKTIIGRDVRLALGPASAGLYSRLPNYMRANLISSSACK